MHSNLEGEQDCTNNPRLHTFVTLSSGKCAGKNSSSVSAISNENNISSTAIFNENSKSIANSLQSSDGIFPSAQDISAKSEVEIQDAEKRTESSCSNSYFIHSVCSPNENYQEMSMEARSSVPNVNGGTDYSADQNKMKIPVGTKGGNQACNKEDNFCSLYPKEEDLHPGQESSEFLMTKRNYVAVEEENGLDLNDDIQKTESNVIRAKAKVGPPLFLPTSTQKFLGELGWKGASPTSAFRRPSFPKSTTGNTISATKDSRGSIVIDLNLTAEEDCPTREYPWENEKRPSVLPSKDSSSYDFKSDLKQEEKFMFDLNAPGDNGDDCPQSSSLVNFAKSALMDLNLSYNPLIGEACDNHIPWQRSHTSVPILPTKPHPREHLSILGPVHRPDSSLMEVYNRVCGPPLYVERAHRFVPVQPQLSPYGTQILPSYCYAPNASFFVSQPDSIPANNLCYGVLPYARDPHGFPQVLNANNFHGTPYLLGAVPSGSTELQPRYNMNNGDFSLANRSGNETTRQLMTPSQNTELRFLQQVGPTKRGEPDGGWDAYQLGIKRTPPSH